MCAETIEAGKLTLDKTTCHLVCKKEALNYAGITNLYVRKGQSKGDILNTMGLTY